MESSISMSIVSTVLLLILLFECSLSCSDDVCPAFPTVITSLGTIEGYYKTSDSGKLWEAYEGIPYARPPIGELRFEVPRPISPWTGVLMAKRHGPSCTQWNLQEKNPVNVIQGSEDCLYLNIYAPAVDDSSVNDQKGKEATGTNLRPVIFFIHGGAFQFGSAKDYGLKYLLETDVMFVNFNYRVGILGFLSTEDEVVPGNMGLKDQAIALRWVHDNIKSFGGDPTRITLFGHSSGASSVHYHYLSNLTKGLFQGGMSLSGTALNCWAQSENLLEKSKKVAMLVKCPTDNIRHMIDCLKGVPADEIVETIIELKGWMQTSYSPFGPIAEKAGGEMTFIDRPPIEIISSGEAHDVPWITGVVSEEGLFPAGYFIANSTMLNEVNSRWEAIAPHVLEFNWTIPKAEHSEVSRLIREHYIGTGPFSKLVINETIQMVSDRMFVYDAIETAKLQARKNQSPVRFYYFTYRGAFGLSDEMTGTKEAFGKICEILQGSGDIVDSKLSAGVSHEDDLLYVLKAFFDTSTTPQDRAMQKKLINLWVSFTTDGTPDVGVEWPTVSRSSEEILYLHIAGPEDISVKETTPSLGERNFWRAFALRENSNNNPTIV